MLTDNQLEQLSYELVPMFQELEQDVINDIARRVKKTKRWTETAELQAKSLLKLGYSPSRIRTEVFKVLNADKEFQALVAKNTLEHKKEVMEKIKATVENAKKQGNNLIANAGSMAFANDLKLWNSAGKKLGKSNNLKLLNKEFAKRLDDEFDSITKSLGFKDTGINKRIEEAYVNALNNAMIKVSSGAYSTEQAVQEAVNSLEKSGLRQINFASGMTRGLDVAVRLAVRTTSAQLSGSIMMENNKEMGEDLVEVSSHIGARTDGSGSPSDHAYWQGKVYSISGAKHDEESQRLGYPILKLETATGYPSNPTGLCGYNCSHTFYTFFEGVSEPNPVSDPATVEVDGNTYTYYQATQKQRQIERELRAVKREYIGGNDMKMGAIKAKEHQYARFCEKAGLKQNLSGIYVKGYKRDFEYLKDNINLAKAIESIFIKTSKTLAKFSPENLLEELQQSPVGIETIKAIRDLPVKIKISESGSLGDARGQQQGNEIAIFSGSIKNRFVAGQTLIHEMAHYRFDVGNCQHAEAICFSMEKMHLERRDYLTQEEWNRMKKLAIDNYPEYNWEKGGYGNYEQFNFVKKE